MRLPYISRSLFCKVDHRLRCRIELRINPGVTRIEPDGEMAVLTPRGSSGLNDLLRRMRGQIFTRRCEPEISFVCCVANELFQENWSFEPPVPEQFRIERSDNDRIETDFADFANLLDGFVLESELHVVLPHFPLPFGHTGLSRRRVR